MGGQQQQHLEEPAFNFQALPGEIRNQIYLETLGPAWERQPLLDSCLRFSHTTNTSMMYLNRKTREEFLDVLWDHLSVSLVIDQFMLPMDELKTLLSMTRLQKCSINIRALPFRREGLSLRFRETDILDVEQTVFGLPHRLNRMPNLRQIDLNYSEEAADVPVSYWLRYCDGSFVQHLSTDIKDVFSQDLRGMKAAHVTGSLCDECAASVASSMKRPKEIQTREPERCVPHLTTSKWSEKLRRWL